MTLSSQFGHISNIRDNKFALGIRLPKIAMLKAIFHPFLQTPSSRHFHRMNTGHEIRTAAQEMGNCNLVRRKQLPKKSERQLEGVNCFVGIEGSLSSQQKTTKSVQLPKAWSKCHLLHSCRVSKVPRLMGFSAFDSWWASWCFILRISYWEDGYPIRIVNQGLLTHLSIGLKMFYGPIKLSSWETCINLSAGLSGCPKHQDMRFTFECCSKQDTKHLQHQPVKVACSMWRLGVYFCPTCDFRHWWTLHDLVWSK